MEDTIIIKLFCKKCKKDTEHEIDSEIIADSNHTFSIVARCKRCRTKQILNDVRI